MLNLKNQDELIQYLQKSENEQILTAGLRSIFPDLDGKYAVFCTEQQRIDRVLLYHNSRYFETTNNEWYNENELSEIFSGKSVIWVELH